jgi:hypothetical protein
MSAFTVELDNQPGELARLCEAMASSGVNLLLCATTHGNSGVVAFIADDEAAAQAALEGADIQYLIRPAVTVKMANLPGAGAATFHKLADAGRTGPGVRCGRTRSLGVVPGAGHAVRRPSVYTSLVSHHGQDQRTVVVAA